MTTQYFLAAIYGTGMLAWLLWPSLSAMVSRWKLPSITTPTAPAAPSDVSDLAALKQVEDRYKRLECNEGLAACQVLYAHFFHRGEHDA